MNKILRKTLIISSILIVTIIGILLELIYLYKNNSDKNLNISSEQIYLEKETIETTINKINDLFIKNGIATLINKEKLIVRNNIYYYQIYDDINIYFKPIEYVNNITSEITQDIGIYYLNKSDYEGKAKIYLKILINSNNNELSNDDIEELIDSTISNSKENKYMYYNGISLRYFSTDNNYKEFIIRRNYK